jgi:hypothetical protein
MVLSPEDMWAKLAEVNKESERDMTVVTAGVKDAIMKNIKRRLTPQPLKIRADLEMTCFQYGGVEHIKVRCGDVRGPDCSALPTTTPMLSQHAAHTCEHKSCFASACAHMTAVSRASRNQRGPFGRV